MISLIIASANKDQLLNARINIEATIGVAYEILVFENYDGSKGLCEIYNKGAAVAQYPILCFMHEDIEMVTQNWGLTVVEYFNANKQLGLLGVAGASYKSRAPSGWVGYGNNNIFHYNLIQHFKYANQPPTHLYNNPNEAQIVNVVAIDGVWMCTRKAIVMEECPFDEILFKGFHGYDVDFSLSVWRKHEVSVTYNILLKHFSEGKFETDWLRAMINLSSKWQSFLPLKSSVLTPNEMRAIEYKTARHFLKQMRSHNYKDARLTTMLLSLKKMLNVKQLLKLFFYYFT